MPLRDLVLFGIVFGSIPFILRQPHIGVLMYVWLSVMNPHRLVWDFAYGFQFAYITALATLISVALNRDTKAPPVNGLTISLALFFTWTGVTTFFAFYPAESYQEWVTLGKTVLMSALIPMVFHTREHLRHLIWVIVLSIAYYGTKGGIWVLYTGGVNRVWGPLGSYIEDNNAIAAALVIMIPLMRYLQLTTSRWYVRWGLTVMMVLCGVAVLGTHSRGALLAIFAMVLFLCWKTRHKIRVVLAACITIPLALSVMPDHWYERMDTIRNYHEESSANMRLNAWETMVNIANDHPVTGAGFYMATLPVWKRYSPDQQFPPQGAHSIYFQALGEHGYVGLALYLLFCFMMWRYAGRLTRLTRDRADLAWAHHLGAMMQVTLIAFLVAGAFLNLILFDVPYYLVSIVVAAMAITQRQLSTAPSTSGPAAGSLPLKVAGGPLPSPRAG
jgi:putative inorganic carbon (hco3(-)) transporter